MKILTSGAKRSGKRIHNEMWLRWKHSWSFRWPPDTSVSSHISGEYEVPLVRFFFQWQENQLFGCALSLYPIKTSRDFAIQSEVRPKTNVTCEGHKSSRASRQRLLEHVFAWSFDWFGGFSSFLMIGRNDYFGFSDDTRLSTSEYMKVHIFELRRMIWRCDWSSQVNT